MVLLRRFKILLGRWISGTQDITIQKNSQTCVYMPWSARSAISFCFLSFFCETFFFSGSAAAADAPLAKAPSFSTRASSMWQGELM